MERKKKLWIIAGGCCGLLLLLNFWIIWKPLWEGPFISRQTPQLERRMRTMFLLPPEESYASILPAINKRIFDQIDKKKDPSDDTAAALAANVIFPIDKEKLNPDSAGNADFIDERNRLIWKFVSSMNREKASDIVFQEFASGRDSILKTTLNPLSYVDYALHRRYSAFVLEKNMQAAESALKDIKVLTLITLRPEHLAYDPNVIAIQVENSSISSLLIDRVTFNLEASSDLIVGKLVYNEDKSGNFSASDRIISSITGQQATNTVSFSGLDQKLPGKNTTAYSQQTFFAIFNKQLEVRSVDLSLTNPLTGVGTSASASRLVDDGTFRYLAEVSESPEDFVRKHPEFLLKKIDHADKPAALLPSGNYALKETVIVPDTLQSIVLGPGTTIKSAPGVSFLSYSPVLAQGTEKHPITFTALSSAPWGTFAIVNTKTNKSLVSHVVVQDAGPTTVNGIIFSGGLAAHYADIEITDSVFRHNHGDDGVNIKYATAVVRRNLFTDNDSDGLDLDSVAGIIDNNQSVRNGFKTGGGDGFDLSWTSAEISNNILSDNKDKCLSIGEKSTSNVSRNTMTNCDIGIAVKDLSNTLLVENIITHNRQGLAVYQKKPIFGGGVARLENNDFSDNQTDIWTDEVSTAIDKNT